MNQIYTHLCPACFGLRVTEIVDYRTHQITYYPCGRCGGAGVVETTEEEKK